MWLSWGDPKLPMISSYLSVLGIKVYDLTGGGLESGQMYICSLDHSYGGLQQKSPIL